MVGRHQSLQWRETPLSKELIVRKKPTLELPKYVHRVLNGVGREYFYFQRGRCSSSQGERVRLPGGPHTPEFWAAYQNCLGGDVLTGKTFDDLITAYSVSPEFIKRAEATKKDYRRYLDIISRAWGPLLVASCRPKHVIHLRDKWAVKPVTANYLVAVLRLLIGWGIPREFSDSNPCIHVPKLETSPEGARPWPAWAYKQIDECGREDMRRAVLLARYTGQRQADVLRMSPSDIEDGGINVTQQKTGKELWVPLHPNLRGALANWICSPFVQTPKGEAYTPDRFRAAWAHLMASTPAGRIRDEGFVFHGLRASSCEKLREAGCGDREIEAITGMSPDMITRYSRFADQKTLARAAARRLEEQRTVSEPRQ
jgi:integrase